MRGLSEPAYKLYVEIQTGINNGKAPAIRELSTKLGISTRKTLEALRELEDSLIIKRSPYRSRSIEIVTPLDEETGRAKDSNISIPILGTAPGGPWLFAEENIEDSLSVPSRLIKGQKDVYLLRVVGNSMSPYLDDSDLALVKKQEYPSERDVVVAVREGIDGYEAKVKDNVDKTKVPIQGSKTFSYPFTVSKAGKYTIDSIAFSYFDPVTSSYKTLHTAPLEVIVKKGKHNFFQKEAAKNSADTNSLFSKRNELIAGIGFVVLIIFLVLFLIIKKNKDKNDLQKNIKVDDLKNEANDENEEFLIPQSPLTEAYEKLKAGDGNEFYHVLDASLKKYLCSKFKVPANELSKKRLNEELDKCNVSLGTSLMLTSLMDEVEINLYTPHSNTTGLNNIFEKASEVVSLLDKQVC